MSGTMQARFCDEWVFQKRISISLRLHYDSNLPSKRQHFDGILTTIQCYSVGRFLKLLLSKIA